MIFLNALRYQNNSVGNNMFCSVENLRRVRFNLLSNLNCVANIYCLFFNVDCTDLNIYCLLKF